MVTYGMVQLFFSADEPSETRAGRILVLVNDNWKAVLLVMVPVFYLPIRGFINRIGEITIAGTTIRTAAGSHPEPEREERNSRG